MNSKIVKNDNQKTEFEMYLDVIDKTQHNRAFNLESPQD